VAEHGVRPGFGGIPLHLASRHHRAVLPVLAQLEERLAPFDPRPHWGKLFTMDSGAGYDKLPGFTGLMARFDPAGKFSQRLHCLRLHATAADP